MRSTMSITKMKEIIISKVNSHEFVENMQANPMMAPIRATTDSIIVTVFWLRQAQLGRQPAKFFLREIQQGIC